MIFHLGIMLAANIDGYTIGSRANKMNVVSIVQMIQSSVFGDWRKGYEDFPRPLPENEAGSSPSGQRRYLWTDAFGILNFCSLAMATREVGIEQASHLQAAKKLIDAVYICLGNPKSSQYSMLEDPGGGFIGLRIGKNLSRIGNTDIGMTYDGMYWHYIDKFIFAVCRYVHLSQDGDALKKVVHLIKGLHPYFCVADRGYLWKINTDCSRIPGLDPYPNHDAVTALCVYRIANKLSHGQLDSECRDLESIVVKYFDLPIEQILASARDELGLGLHLFSNQFFEGPKAQHTIEATQEIVKPVVERWLSSSSDESELNFRFYGTLLGMQLTGDASLTLEARQIVSRMVDAEMNIDATASRHFAINKVMLASALIPLAFRKLSDEENITL